MSERPLGECAAAWARARWVRVGKWEVRYREAGAGPPLVLAHGLGLSADYWRRNGPPLAAAGYRVLAPDLPGFGRTPGPSTGLSVAGEAEALCSFAEALGLGPARYVGHSISCQGVLWLAAHEPHRVAGLVLAAPTGAPVPRRRLRQMVGLVRDIPRESLEMAAVVARAYLQAGPLRVIRTWLAQADEDPLTLLPHVTAPGGVVVGGRDPVVDVHFAAALAAGLPQGKLVCIRDASHGLVFTSAKEFNAAVLEILAAPPVPR